MNEHKPVLLDEVIAGLAIKKDGTYLDLTFGRGGHSGAILNELGANGRLFAVDKDLDAVNFGKEKFKSDSRFSIIHSSFEDVAALASSLQIKGLVDGILLDLGVSSPQLDQAVRGFSFMQEGPLDMRMNQTQPFCAQTFVNSAKAEEMAAVFKEYGEERFAKRIARAIVSARELKPISTTLELAKIVVEANPKWEKHKHPATRVFQAIRMHVNGELPELTKCLQQCIAVLAPGGRLVVISFHSLEDRIVKQFMRKEEDGEALPISLPIRHQSFKTFKRIGKKIKASEAELKANIRARSAVLRIGEKIS